MKHQMDYAAYVASQVPADSDYWGLTALELGRRWYCRSDNAREQAFRATQQELERIKREHKQVREELAELRVAEIMRRGA